MRKTLALAVTAAALFGGATAQAATTEVVREADVTRQLEGTAPTDTWVLYTRAATPGTGTFRVGPAEPPLGGGSFELTTTGGSDKVFLYNFDHAGTALADVDEIAYSTYRTAGNVQQVAALNLVVDENGPADGGFTTLVFEPVYNTAQGPVVSGEWQDWSGTGDAIWWSTRPIPGVCAFSCYVTWDAILEANPDATILSGVGVNQGSGNPGLTTAVDAFTFDETTYDFEAAPTTKDDCKGGGFASYGYTNQGECVSAVASRNK